MLTSARVWASRREQASPLSGEARTFLMDAFRTFYVETVRQVEVATRAKSPDHPDGAAPEDAIRAALAAALKRLNDGPSAALTEQENALRKEARYVMVALADDLLIAVDWRGRQAWMKAPLEASEFKTYEAGEKFFTRLDEYVRPDRKKPASSDILYVYLMALCLGFRGRYAKNASARPDAPDPVEQYCDKIRDLIERLSPGAARPPAKMCRAAAAHTVKDRPPQSLDSLLQPLGVALGLAVVSLVISALVWPGEVTYVIRSLDRIEVLP